MLNKLSVSLFFLCPLWLQAQTTPPDTAFLQSAIKNSVDLYTRTIKGETFLYNGSEYREPRQTNDLHPFFESDDWVFGTVDYDGQIFTNVPLLYDITNDILVTEHYYNADEISLVNEKLSGFTIGNHTFRKIKNETVNNSLPRSGFYEILYDGPSKVIARRHKEQLSKIVSNTEIEINFDSKDRYYVYKNDHYFPVKNKASFLRIFGDEKRNLKQFLSKNKAQFRSDREYAFKQLAAQYDNLKTQK